MTTLDSMKSDPGVVIVASVLWCLIHTHWDSGLSSDYQHGCCESQFQTWDHSQCAVQNKNFNPTRLRGGYWCRGNSVRKWPTLTSLIASQQSAPSELKSRLLLKYRHRTGTVPGPGKHWWHRTHSQSNGKKGFWKYFAICTLVEVCWQYHKRSIRCI